LLSFNYNNTHINFRFPQYQSPQATWRQKPVHHRVHKSQPPVPILRQVNPLHTPPSKLPKIHSNPILPFTPVSSEWSLSFGLFHLNLTHFSLLSHACHIPRPPHSPSFHLPNYIRCWMQIMKLSTTFPILPLLHLRSKHSPQSPCLLLIWETKFHTHTKQLAELWLCIF
jgi:hypothetical protein